MTRTPETVVVEITRIEALHLRGLVSQFVDLLQGTEAAASDPAVARLVPTAYPDDEDAAEQFRAVSQPELLRRRTDDAATVLADLADAGDAVEPAALPTDEALEEIAVVLDRDHTASWLRTLSAVRLVLASRLGIASEDDHDPDDPRFGIYEWLGYRLDGLVRAATPDED